MQVMINNQPVALPEATPILKMLETLNKNSLKDNDNGIAIAVNQAIIRRSDWDNYTLSEGDQITLIKATAGG